MPKLDTRRRPSPPLFVGRGMKNSRKNPLQSRGPWVARTALMVGWLTGLSLGGCDALKREEKKGPEGRGGDEKLLRQVETTGDPRLYVETRTHMGTLYRLIVAVDGVKETKVTGPLSPPSVSARKKAKEACGKAFEEVARVEGLMSVYLKDSQVSKINRVSKKAAKAQKKRTPPIKVDREVLLVIQEAIQVSRLSKGAFDVTFAAAGDLWYDREKKKGRVPSKKEVAELLSRVGYKKIEVDEKKKTLSLAAGQQLGLGGIAKGYALDRAALTLRENGFKNFIVYGGGDLFVSGRHPDRAWRVGIQHPRKKGRYFATLDVTNVAVVTSGDYERYFEQNGKRYHHILDPKTGRPAEGMRSVTVLSDRAVYSDAMATALFVMGVDKGKRLVDRLSDTEAMLVDSKNRVVVTSGLKSRIQILMPLEEDKAKKSRARKTNRSATRPTSRPATSPR